MSDYEINDVASVGWVEDIPSHQLPPEAWGKMENVRMLDTQQVEKLKGWTQVFGTPSVAPHFIINLIDPVQTWWIYTSLTAAYVFDGTNHTNITRLSGAYTAANSKDWDGTILGGIPVINNGADKPQFWADYNVGTKLADLTNWPADTLCKAIKAFSPYLVAVNITKSGDNHPHMVKWSHGAEVGALPSSWDETDPTVDAGEVELDDTTAGMLLNLGQLSGQMYLYKQGSVHRMQKIGGRTIFRFDKFVETNGLIGPKAFCQTPDGRKHVCVFQDDIVQHDGQRVVSLLEGRLKRMFFNSVSPTAYSKIFCFPNSAYNEVWICYPERGFSEPNRALILNTVTNTISQASIDFACAATGPVEHEGTDLWSTAVGTWDTYAGGPWGQIDRRATLVGNPSLTKIFQLDKGVDRNSEAFPARVYRQGLALMGRTREGRPIVDFKQRKQYNRIWLKATGVPFMVRLGIHEYADGEVTWSEAQLFDPNTQQWVDFVQSGRAVAIECYSIASGDWRIHGYKPEVVKLGNF